MKHLLSWIKEKVPLRRFKSGRESWQMQRGFLVLALTVILGVAFFGVPAIVRAADPTGGDTLKANPNAAVNMAWTLITGFLVWFMQLGFAFLGAGLIRSKNNVNYWTKSFMDFCIASLGFWAFGFALMFGGSKFFPGLEEGNSWIGFSGFFLSGPAYDVSTIMMWFFQMVFAATACTIVAGAVAERMKITAYLAYAFVIGAIIYPIYGKWIWGGGWLSTLNILGATGARDFAGSGVVHMVGGLAALIGAAMVGPRIGKYNADGTPNTIKGHNLPFVVVGTFILFFGWFGFNPGSTLAATDLRISVIAVNTFLAGVTGAVVALYWVFAKTGKMDIIAGCNGCLVGLVAVTAPCAFIEPWAAVVIGAIAVPIMIATSHIVEKVLKVDDAVGAVPVHFAGGLWGLISVGIFADGTYLGVKGLITGEVGQLLLQLVDIAALVAWVAPTMALTFFVIKKTIGLRASRKEELRGLDIPEHGIESYPTDDTEALPSPVSPVGLPGIASRER
ncbi:MAG: ammonium transporter [Dehalococcoidales bacterium]|nr:ammonium transporter [Dehalococcoidales bacterium]